MGNNNKLLVLSILILLTYLIVLCCGESPEYTKVVTKDNGDEYECTLNYTESTPKTECDWITDTTTPTTTTEEIYKYNCCSKLLVCHYTAADHKTCQIQQKDCTTTKTKIVKKPNGPTYECDANRENCEITEPETPSQCSASNGERPNCENNQRVVWDPVANHYRCIFTS